MMRAWIVTLFLLLLPWVGARAQLAYSGGLLVQDFDSLPMAGVFDYAELGVGKGPALLAAPPIMAIGAPGWSLFARVGSQLTFLVGDGTAATAAVYSYGHPGGVDRALGSLAGGAQAASLGWRLVNQSGQTITRLTISFYAEQWRNGGTASLAGFTGEYRIAATGDIDTGSYTAVPALDVTALSAVSGSSFSMNGNSSRTERSATITGISWANGQTLILRWRDLDETGADNGLALDDVLFHAPTASATPPRIHSARPVPHSGNVPPSAPVVLIFDQPVTPLGTWVEVTGSSSGSLPVTISHAGPLRYTLTPDTAWPAGETVTVRVFASQVSSLTSEPMVSDYSLNFTPLPGTEQVTPISAIQGADGYSPLAGAQVTVQGVVTGNFQGSSPALGGFFLQEEPKDQDADPATSEALWIADRGSTAAIPVEVGEVLRLTGTVSEFGALTQLTSITAVEKIGTAPLPPALAVTLPAASAVSLEPQEAMRVIFPQTLTVTSNSGGGATDGFAQFGELLLSSGGPQLTPTEWIDPNDDPASGTTTSGNSNVPAIRAQERQAPLRTILLDDGSTATFPFPMPHLSGEGTRRCGDTVTDLTGILAYNFNAWRIQPTDPIPWVDANPRPAQPPDVGGRLRVASMNVLNYFTTFGGSNDRGASSAEEFARQKAKIIAALAGLDAHIIGLMEIQNSPSAISDLLSGLNDAVTDDYAVVADPPGGYPLAGTNADFIRCLLIYRPSRITPRGDCQMDTDGVWFVATPTAQEPDKRNPLRFPLAQVFEENDSGERFSVCVNHWKSKSSIDATGLNLNQNDGQAAFNHLRRQQAARLDAWLQGVAAITGEPDVLIIGDLNSYGEEDPLDTLRAAGWQDQGQRFQGVGDYSYRLGGQRGRLDHAFASASMAAQITGQDHWHINADEPAFLDYNVENKKPGHLPMNLGTPYRSSDHDPVLIGIRLNVPEVDYAAWQASRTWQPGNSPLPEEDPDGDGLVNLAEFAMNLDPESPSGGSQWLEIIPHPDGLRVRHRRHLQALGVQIIAEWSPDLEHWTPLVPAPNITPLDARTESLQYDLPVDTEAPRGFTRLRFETTP